jgi:hypothetical protein
MFCYGMCDPFVGRCGQYKSSSCTVLDAAAIKKTRSVWQQSHIGDNVQRQPTFHRGGAREASEREGQCHQRTLTQEKKSTFPKRISRKECAVKVDVQRRVRRGVGHK